MIKKSISRPIKIAVTGGKGGTGKSMVATSLAALSAENKKTLLVDADAECPNDHLLLNVKLKKAEKIRQPIPKWNFKKCVKCGLCARACQKNAIIFVQGRYPAFIKDACIGCQACLAACPQGAISKAEKEIGRISTGKNFGVDLVSGELKLGELASGEVVAEVRKYADKTSKRLKSEIVLIDSAAGIGCPVIASLAGTDYIIAVTEPTPSALHDLKRVLYLARHLKIKHGIIINKRGLSKEYSRKIENFAAGRDIPVIGRIPYNKDFLSAMIKMRPIAELKPDYRKIFAAIIKSVNLSVK